VLTQSKKLSGRDTAKSCTQVPADTEPSSAHVHLFCKVPYTAVAYSLFTTAYLALIYSMVFRTRVAKYCKGCRQVPGYHSKLIYDQVPFY
jgi:hypothetical protein